jgi:hypothetical protein
MSHIIRLSFNMCSHRLFQACTPTVWTRIYALIIVVVIPAVIKFINYFLIFNHVRSSTRRIQTSLTSASASASASSSHAQINQQSRIQRRDWLLLKNTIVMLAVFVGGWTPIHIVSIFVYDTIFSMLVPSLLVLLAQLSLLIIIINLFINNHKLTKYCRDFLCKYVSM